MKLYIQFSYGIHGHTMGISRQSNFRKAINSTPHSAHTHTHAHAKSTAIHTISFRLSTLHFSANIHMFGALIRASLLFSFRPPTSIRLSWRALKIFRPRVQSNQMMDINCRTQCRAPQIQIVMRQSLCYFS